jgi:hypothetical protein
MIQVADVLAGDHLTVLAIATALGLGIAMMIVSGFFVLAMQILGGDDDGRD